MIDNGYLFAKDNKRIFINTSLGCAGQCAYCYLPKMGYSNGSDNYRTISAQTIIEFIEKNKLDINQKTLITLGCYSECWDEYNKNETKIIIIKKDQDDGKVLEGIEFQLLNDKKEVIYADLKTDSDGKIVIENLVPGNYYIKEIKTIDGYELYEYPIQVEVGFNQEVSVTVNNKKEEKPQIITNKTASKEIKRLPVTGM